jgi:hypothetical protein
MRSDDERSTAAREDGHGVELASMHEEGDEDDLSQIFLTKGYGAWAVSGVGLDHGLLLGWC